MITNFDEFIVYCNKGYCLRKTFYNEKNCIKKIKQEKCYNKYKEKQERKIEIDHKYNEFVVAVWKDTFKEGHDGFSTKKNWKKYCRIWSILTEDEKEYIEKNYQEDLFLNEHLDCCHIFPKGENIQLKYSKKNGVICGRLFHNLLDQYKHPVTRKNITKEERLHWFRRAKLNKEK
jgi:single-stranded DNA-specific DHH superfamily exonuclease